MIRHLRPRRYLEIGSGWSTALALDTNDQWLDGSMRVTCIEPYPDDLNKLLRPEDDVEVLSRGVQGVELERFADLEPGDILFIDCSHVVKTGSDAHYLITRVLPIVPVGVYIHIHDIFWAFEYPDEWVYEGRAWNEAYLCTRSCCSTPPSRSSCLTTCSSTCAARSSNASSQRWRRRLELRCGCSERRNASRGSCPGRVQRAGSGPCQNAATSIGRQVRQKSSPNGVRWMLRRTMRGRRPARLTASATSGCTSTTW